MIWLGCVNSVRWSNNGQYLASGSDDKLIMIWQYANIAAYQNNIEKLEKKLLTRLSVSSFIENKENLPIFLIHSPKSFKVIKIMKYFRV